MNAQRWRQIEELYHAVLKYGPGERVAFLEEACVGNAELRSQVETLLAQKGSVEGRLTDRAVPEHQPCRAAREMGDQLAKALLKTEAKTPAPVRTQPPEVGQP